LPGNSLISCKLLLEELLTVGREGEQPEIVFPARAEDVFPLPRLNVDASHTAITRLESLK